MRVYVAIDTSTPYRLPIMVTDTAKEMAERLKLDIHTVYSTASRSSKGKEMNIIKVEIDDD